MRLRITYHVRYRRFTEGKLPRNKSIRRGSTTGNNVQNHTRRCADHDLQRAKPEPRCGSGKLRRAAREVHLRQVDGKRPTHRLGGPSHKDGTPTTRPSETSSKKT